MSHHSVTRFNAFMATLLAVLLMTIVANAQNPPAFPRRAVIKRGGPERFDEQKNRYDERAQPSSMRLGPAGKGSVGQHIGTSQATDVRVTDIGPEQGVSFAGAGFVINRNDPRQILVPSPAGILKSVNGGHTWSRVFNGGVLFLRQDPSNPSAIFATDENGAFLIRSNDFFESWSFITQLGCATCHVDVAIHQASSQIVLLLAREGAQGGVLLRSNDGGETFAVQSDDGLPPYGRTYTNIETTAADPNIVYVVMNDDPIEHSGGIFKSIDGGHTFNRLEESPLRPLQVFTHPTDANVLFVQVSSAFSTSPGIYRSVDGGASFQPVTGGLTNANFFVAFDPHHPSYVYVAGQGGFFRSTDGGTTFRSTGLTREQLGLGATTATVDPANPSTIYVNTNLGNFKSVNGGVTFTSISKGWTASQATHIAFDNANNPSLFVVGPYGAGIFKTQTRGNHYDEVMNPLPLSLISSSAWPELIAVAPSDPARIVVATSSRGVFVTRDGGQKWRRSSMDTQLRTFRKIVIDSLNPNNVYLLANSGFYRSTDGGLTFESTQVSPEEFSMQALAMDPSNPQVIYIGGYMYIDCVEVDDGEGGTVTECNEVTALLKSTDGGVTFAAPELLEFYSLHDITVDPNNSNNVYLAGFGYAGVSVMRSSDGGATFAAADAGMEFQGYNPTARELVIDPRHSTRLFALTDVGLFMSRDGAASWTRVNNEVLDRADFTAHSLTIDPKRPNLLYLAGATVFEIEIK
jgi:photosystem II stability/assembly factor-like uncharacterized protein